MKFFIDTASVEEIKDALQLGVLDGVTTNPTLVAKTGRGFKEVIMEICNIVEGPVSAEVVSLEAEGMIREGRLLAGWAPNIVVKIPILPEGLKAIKTLSQDNIKINTTLIFNPLQALMAAKAGATYVSPFLGRLDDVSSDGMRFLRPPVEDTGLLRMTKWMVEIATSSNQKTVGLLAMTDLDRYFHPHLVLLCSMKVYPEN
jgi:transaldolase